MIIRVCYFTRQGKKLAEKLMEKWEDPIWQTYSRETALAQWTEECFQRRLPILFIGACGIAVRTIAPYVRDKLLDSPVLVLDEMGKFVIPILSGHVGGANRLAVRLSEVLEAQAVLTTATDVEGMFSVDVFARDNGFRIVGRDGIKQVSAKLLRGEKVRIAVEPGIEVAKGQLPKELELVDDPAEGNVDVRLALKEDIEKEQTLLLVAKEYVLGMGCKKGKTFEELFAFLNASCQINWERDAFAMASINLKKREEGLWGLAQFGHLPLSFYTAEELENVKGDFAESEFVKEVTGTSNVCERAALCLAGQGGVLIQKKTAENGMTLAVAKRKVRIKSWGEKA